MQARQFAVIGPGGCQGITPIGITVTPLGSLVSLVRPLEDCLDQSGHARWIQLPDDCLEVATVSLAFATISPSVTAIRHSIPRIGDNIEAFTAMVTRVSGTVTCVSGAVAKFGGSYAILDGILTRRAATS